MTASPEIRAKRRWEELKSKGLNPGFDEVYQNLITRDRIDSSRKASPLIKTDDAVTIDNSELTRQEQLELVLNLVEKITGA
jgi:cytidylate kinase